MRYERIIAIVVLPALAAVVCALSWPALFPARAADALGAFIGEARWSEARSALPLPYRPYRGVSHLADYSRVLGALHAPAVRLDPQQPLAVAAQYVWRGGAGDAQRAESLLEAQPESAVVWNERALVRLARGLPVDALAAVDRALELDPALAAARFNRAVVLERVFARHEAIEALEHFLAIEGRGPWAEEAKVRLERLQRGLPEAAGYEAAQALLSDGLFAVRDADTLHEWTGRADVKAALEQLGALGDRLYAAEIAWLHQLDEKGWAARNRKTSAYPDLRQSVFDGTVELRHLAELRHTDDPLLAVRYTHLAAYDRMQRRDGEGALVFLEALRSLCVRLRCLEESVTAASDQGTVLFGAGDYQGAQAAFERALASLPAEAVYRRSELFGKLGRLAADLGAPARATELTLQAARLSYENGLPLSLAIDMLNLGTDAQRAGEPGVAAAFAREARRVAADAGLARIEQLAGNLLAASQRARGRHEEAERVLEEGWLDAQAAAIPHVLAGNRLELAEVRLAQLRPAEALALLREVEPLPETVLDAEDLVRRRRLSVEALLQQGDLRRAADELERTLAQAGARLDRAPSPLAAQRMVAMHAGLRARLALLRAQLDGAAAAWPALAPDGVRALDGDECIVASVPVGNDLALFSATRSAAAFEVVPGRASEPAAAGDLLERCGAGTRRLTLLDAAWTDAAPWARAVRRLHPHVAVVLAGDARTPWPDTRLGGSGLVVHSPRPVPPSRGLAYLYGAAREAALVRGALGDVAELHDEAATPGAVREHVAGRSLLHFAVHGDSNDRLGAASFLVLAGDDGLLQVVDVLALPLAASEPVVVLSACSSGGRTADRENDGAGLTWAFLRAGASAVVSHQDALRDDVALTFAEAFYGAIGKGAGLSTAFERALAAVRATHGNEAAASFLLSV